MSNDHDQQTVIPQDIPEVALVGSYQHIWHGRPTGESWGECRHHDLRFETRDEWKQHRLEEHPLPCSMSACKQIAAYSSVNGPHSYCAECAASTTAPGYRYERVERPANADAPRLPDDHPMEVAIGGLE